MIGPYTRETKNDYFDIHHGLGTEVEYEIDMDGGIIISALILKRKVNYNGQGEYAPHVEELRIGEDWLSRSTLEDLATEIKDSLTQEGRVHA